jgi:RNA polymerase sigma-70 factor, ECF subfamily
MNLSDERDIIEICKKNPQAFGILFDEYYKQIFGYIHRRVLDWDASKDIASEVFLKAYLHIGEFRWLGISIAAWFYRIATNEINLYFRAERYAPDSLDELMEGRFFDNSDEEERQRAEQQVKDSQDFVEVQKHLKSLDIKYQEVIALRFFEDKAIKEIAEILSKNEGTVKSLLSRGLEKIRQKMDI